MVRTVNIKEFQAKLLEMLLSFHVFCVEHHLTYYMVGGTLLGAVREKGFVPWDDDIDIAMPRPDYERFIREYSGSMYVNSIHSNKRHFFPYTKLISKEEPALEIEDTKYSLKGTANLQLDLYPVDGVGNDEKKALSLEKKVRFLKRILYINITTDRGISLIKNCIRRIVRVFPTGIILKEIDKTMQSFSYFDSNLCTRWREINGITSILDKRIFGAPVLLQFEDFNFYAPQNYDAYLTAVYGDYMTPKRENLGLRHDIRKSNQQKQSIITKQEETS